MSTLLHIAASPRRADSESRRIAEAFIETYRSANPSHTIRTLDLWSETLPVFDGDKAGAKMTVIGGGTPQGAQATAWSVITDLFDRFNAADRYVFSVPMWNSGIPYVLKQFIDVITQPGLLFGFDPATGYSGLLKNKKAAVIYTSGVYKPGVPPAFGTDFHSTYFNDWLNFAGIREIRNVRFQPTLLSADVDAERAASLSLARSAALSF